MTFRLIAGVYLLLSGVAVASCPTGADLDTGLRFKLDDGSTETFTRTGPYEVTADFRSVNAPDDSFIRVLLGQGLYVLDATEYDGGTPIPESRMTNVFQQPVATLPLPVPGGTSSFVVEEANSAGVRTQTQAFSYAAETQVAYGACTYRMIPVTVDYVGGDLRDFVHYFPDLGVSYLAGWANTSGERSYNYVALHRVQ